MDGRINRRRALELAVQHNMGGLAVAEVVALADQFYTFLNAGDATPAQSPVAPPVEHTRPTGGAPREESEPEQLKGKLPAASAPHVSRDEENPWQGMDVV